MNKKGISLLSIVITIIVIILLATITIVSNPDSIDYAIEGKFQSALKECVKALDVYQQRAAVYAYTDYQPNELTWDGVSAQAENTAQIESKGAGEDSIRYIFSQEVPGILKGVIEIKEGKIQITDAYQNEIQHKWATDLYNYME